MTIPHMVLGGQAEFVKVTEGKAEAHQPGEHTVTWPSRGDIPPLCLHLQSARIPHQFVISLPERSWRCTQLASKEERSHSETTS